MTLLRVIVLCSLILPVGVSWAEGKKEIDKDALVGVWRTEAGDTEAGDIEMAFTKDGKVRTEMRSKAGKLEFNDKYVVKGDRLTLTGELNESISFTKSATIKKLTASELILVWDKVGPDDKPQPLKLKRAEKK